MGKYVVRSHALANRTEPTTPHESRFSSNWNIYLKRLPVRPNNPITVLMNGKLVFQSAEDGKAFNTVTEIISEPIEPNAQSVTVTLKIPVMMVEHSKQFE